MRQPDDVVLARSKHFFHNGIQQSQFLHDPHNWRDFTCGLLSIGCTRSPDSRRGADEFLIAGDKCNKTGCSAGCAARDHGGNFCALNDAGEPHAFDQAAALRAQSDPRYRPAGTGRSSQEIPQSTSVAFRNLAIEKDDRPVFPGESRCQIGSRHRPTCCYNARQRKYAPRHGRLPPLIYPIRTITPAGRRSQSFISNRAVPSRRGRVAQEARTH